MVGILGILNGQGENSQGFKLNGFFNGNPLGNQTKDQSGQANGLMNSVGQSLSQRLGLNLTKFSSPTNTLANQLNNLVKTDKNNKLEEIRKESEKKKDRLETSDKERTDSTPNLMAALKNGATQQVVVSKDGRFEASIDMRLNTDGSYTLDMSVHFANAQAAMMRSTQNAKGNQNAPAEAEQEDESQEEQNANLEEDPTSLANQGVGAAYQRYTSYEQILQTRGFQANIFFEEAKSVAFAAERAYGSEMGNEYMAVAGEVAHEYTLNISISGGDLSNFNQVAEELMQFDDSGTLAGFLEAARNVLTTDSSDLGAFVEATQSLVGATQQHVSTKLTNFFSNMQEQFGGTLEELGFDSHFLENLGNDVQSDLNNFFQITNAMLGNLIGTGQMEEAKDTDTQQLESLNAQLEEMKEKRRDLLGNDPLPPRPERQPVFQNDLPPRPEKGLVNALA